MTTLQKYLNDIVAAIGTRPPEALLTFLSLDSTLVQLTAQQSPEEVVTILPPLGGASARAGLAGDAGELLAPPGQIVMLYTIPTADDVELEAWGTLSAAQDNDTVYSLLEAPALSTPGWALAAMVILLQIAATTCLLLWVNLHPPECTTYAVTT